jgi:hypothetical protein
MANEKLEELVIRTRKATRSPRSPLSPAHTDARLRADARGRDGRVR